MSPFLILIFLFINVKLCLSFELLTTGATVLGVGAIASYSFIKCKYSECCTDDWIRFDEKKLAENFEHNLFGQHLADYTIRKALAGFFKKKNPKKPLVMSFNGLVGSGKNYASYMIANSTYKEGTRSSYVHLYSGVKDFPHKHLVPQYQDRLKEDIIRYTKQCGRSLFIFDEVDKMPPGVLDALKPFIDYHEFMMEGTDFRKNIFIFLSNAGSSSIVGMTLKFWAEGRNREEMTMMDIEPAIHKGSYNENGGFQFSDLLSSELIDNFVPFLPLEKTHVYKCIEVELKNRNEHYNQQLIKEIAENLVYFPVGIELYSKSGCKRLETKIDMYVG